MIRLSISMLSVWSGNPCVWYGNCYGMVWMVWYGMVWMEWYDMAIPWYGMNGVVWYMVWYEWYGIWYGMNGMVYGMVWMVWYDMAVPQCGMWYGMVFAMVWYEWYGMIWPSHGMVLYCYGIISPIWMCKIRKFWQSCRLVELWKEVVDTLLICSQSISWVAPS